MKNVNGKIMFDDMYELYYHLFLEIGLSINGNNYLYDQDTEIPLMYKDKYIKATTFPVPIYAGRNDIVFDPSQNYNLMVSILGYYIDKESNSDSGDNIGFIAQYIEDNDIEMQRVVVKTKSGDYFSQFYHNIDLSNFDLVI